jgi:hypothetical protein
MRSANDRRHHDGTAPPSRSNADPDRGDVGTRPRPTSTAGPARTADPTIPACHIAYSHWSKSMK